MARKYKIFSRQKPNIPSYKIPTKHEVEINNNGKYLISYGAWKTRYNLKTARNN